MSFSFVKEIKNFFKMESLFLLTIFVSLANADVVYRGAMGNCPGSEGYPLQYVDGSVPDVIYIPGTVNMNLHASISADLPSDLIVKLKLKKLEPFPMDVPCLDGLGSCPYDICQTIINMADSLCPSFPASQPCSCPLLKGDLDLKDVQLPVPDFGPILGSLMAGSYDATATVYGDSDPDTILGCIEMSFKFEKA